MYNMNNVESFLKKIAPILSAGLSFAGPPGVLAANLINGIFGTKSVVSGDLSTATTIVASATQDQVNQLQQIELTYKAQMAELGYKSAEDFATITEADRDSARKREMTVKDYMAPLLAILSVVGFTSILVVLFFYKIPVETQTILTMLLGAEVMVYKDVYGYYFGSSAGSDNKTQLLADAAKGNQ